MSIRLLIVVIFNSIIKLEYFPDCWARGEIVPIYKSGDRNLVNNYRGITMLSCVGKLFTRILNARLTRWAEEKDKLDETQFGFRKGKGTNDCLFILNGLIELLFSRGLKLYVCFIDYEKAYDFIDRAALWAKLLKTGVSSKTVRIFKNMYDKMKLSVKGDDRNFSCNCGLLQGESTSPIFFSLFINDIDTHISEDITGIQLKNLLIKILKFADDMCLISETREGLQVGLNDLAKYTKKWGIIINILKTKIVVFRKGGQLSKKDKWILNNTNIEVVQFFKYLGCFLSSSGSYAKCISELTNSARKALFSLKKYFVYNPEIFPITQIKLFNSMVVPILNYGSEVWGLRKADPMEKFHRSFLKYILRVKNSTPNCFIYGELGVFPLYIKRYERVLTYWTKILENKDNENSLVYNIYTELYNLTITHREKITWASLVKDVLFRCGMGNYWIYQNIPDKKHFISTFRRRIQDIYLQEWWAEVRETSTGRLFKHIKTDFKYEQYLNLVNRHLRIGITKIRLSSHSLYVERGRWLKIQKDKRVCIICNVIEDEYHCLVECPRFINERRGKLPITLTNKPTMYDFIVFLKSENITEIRKLGLLCCNVLAEHRNFV